MLLQKAGADVYGVELQPEAVAIANEKLPGRIFQADVYGDAFPTQQFDVITMTGLIEHVTDPTRMLTRCRSLLKPGGVLLLETPNSGSTLAKGLGALWPPYAPVEHIHLFSDKSMRMALEKCGFNNVTIRPHWKTLPVSYVYEMMSNFGPTLRSMLSPIYRVLPKAIREKSLPFYVGEMIITAARSAD